MTMMPCPECQKQISTAANTCPQCGHPLKLYCWGIGYLDERQIKARRNLAGVVLVVVVAIGVGLIGLNILLLRHTQSLPSPEPAAPLVPAACSLIGFTAWGWRRKR